MLNCKRIETENKEWIQTWRFYGSHKRPFNAFLKLIDSSLLWCGNEVTAEDFTLGVPIHDIEQPSIKYGWYDVRFEAFNDQYLRRWILNIPHSTFLFSFCNYINKSFYSRWLLFILIWPTTKKFLWLAHQQPIRF